MKTTTFGRVTGLRVTEYALGFGGFGGQGSGAEDARKVLDCYAAAGGRFLDTSDSYWHGESESILGELLQGRRDDFVVATKYGRGWVSDIDLTRVGNSRRAMVQAVERSLQRLRTDYIDLYWAHYEDGVTPIEEIVHAFDELVQAGKILYGGVSNFPAWRVALGQEHARQHGRSPIAGVQVEHSLIERGAETEVFPMADALGLGLALYSPLGGGLLTAKHRHGREKRPIVVHTEDTSTKVRTIDAIETVASDIGVSPSQVALAWQRACGERLQTSTVTIMGARTVEQVNGYLDALHVQLDDQHVALLNDASRIYRGAPHDGIGGPPDLGDKARIAPANTAIHPAGNAASEPIS